MYKVEVHKAEVEEQLCGAGSGRLDARVCYYAQYSIMEGIPSHQNGSCVTLKPREQTELLLVMGIGGVVSAIVCLAALLLVLGLKLYKRFSHRLASYQVISSLFYSVVCSVQMVMINYHRDPEDYGRVCEALGCILEYAVWVKMLAMLWLTSYLFSFVVCYKSLD